MRHHIYQVTEVEILEPYTLRFAFDDHSEQAIALENILEGELYGPLRDMNLFNQVTIDPEVHTLVWPNGADFDPATLHDWPRYKDALADRAKRWATASV